MRLHATTLETATGEIEFNRNIRREFMGPWHVTCFQGVCYAARDPHTLLVELCLDHPEMHGQPVSLDIMSIGLDEAEKN